MERFGWLRRYVSPVFLALLVASFILWYIAKLNYTYTTEQPFTVNVDGERFKPHGHGFLLVRGTFRAPETPHQSLSAGMSSRR